MAKVKPLPKFQDEDAEREFWAKADALAYFDPATARRAVFPALKPSNKTISLRLPASLLENLKSLANSRDVPYQSLAKLLLAQKVKEEISTRYR